MSELTRLRGRMTDLAPGLRVRRVLAALERRAVGPFVFFDEFGPATLAPTSTATSAATRISGWLPSPISSTAGRCTATASAECNSSSPAP